MSKNKLRRFAENLSFPHVIQPRLVYPPADYELKGKWNTHFFNNTNPVILELGCGKGEYTVQLAQQYLEHNFIGIDRKGARIWRGAKTSHEGNIKNVGFLRIQIEQINHFFAPGEVSEIWITFPDPQPQKSREKKRLTSPSFLEKYKNILKSDGLIHLKTDNLPLYEYTLNVIKSAEHKILSGTDNLYGNQVDETLNIKTTYEKMFLEQGLNICYLCFHLNDKKQNT